LRQRIKPRREVKKHTGTEKVKIKHGSGQSNTRGVRSEARQVSIRFWFRLSGVRLVKQPLNSLATIRLVVTQGLLKTFSAKL
jgi:hypothetical protein